MTKSFLTGITKRKKTNKMSLSLFQYYENKYTDMLAELKTSYDYLDAMDSSHEKLKEITNAISFVYNKLELLNKFK